MIVVPCAETHLVPTLSRKHLVAAPSRLRQRRSVSTSVGMKCRDVGMKCKRRNVSTKCREVWPAAPLSHTPCRCTRAQKAASRGIPLAAAQILSSSLRSRRHPVKIRVALICRDRPLFSHVPAPCRFRGPKRAAAGAHATRTLRPLRPRPACWGRARTVSDIYRG